MYRELIFAARLFVACFLATLLLIWAVAAWGQGKPEGTWWDTPEVRACCSQADAVIADIWKLQPDGSVLATVTDGTTHTAHWADNVIGQTFLVPADKVLSVPGNPTGRALLFIGPTSHHVFCFAPGPFV